MQIVFLAADRERELRRRDGGWPLIPARGEPEYRWSVLGQKADA
jgi:hypothetical protein